MPRGHLYIGTSGWLYKGWQEIFYPKNIKPPEFLTYFSGVFNSVEVNSTFYRLQSTDVFTRWRERTPENFMFSVKLSREITHVRRLKQSHMQLTRFLRHTKRLKEKLSVILIQLPPSMRFDEQQLTQFIKTLFSVTKSVGWKTPRYAFEFRHTTWFEPEAVTYISRIVQKYPISVVYAESSKFPNCYSPALISEFVYLRFHGPSKFAASSYGKRKLEPWAEQIEGWIRNGKDVYAYFNNDVHGYAINNAPALRQLITHEL